MGRYSDNHNHHYADIDDHKQTCSYSAAYVYTYIYNYVCVYGHRYKYILRKTAGNRQKKGVWGQKVSRSKRNLYICIWICMRITIYMTIDMAVCIDAGIGTGIFMPIPM